MICTDLHTCAASAYNEHCARFLEEHGAGEYGPSVPDNGVVYADVRPVDLGTLEPYVGLLPWLTADGYLR
jgi:hypothetical protein